MDLASSFEVVSRLWSSDGDTPAMTDEERVAFARDHAEIRAAVTGVSVLLILILLAYALAHDADGTRATGFAGLFIAAISGMAGVLSAQHDDAYDKLTAHLPGGMERPLVLNKLPPVGVWAAGLYRYWPYFYTATFTIGGVLYFIGGI
jgi:hypothetical protein